MVSGHDDRGRAPVDAETLGRAEPLTSADTEEFHRLVIESMSEGVVVQDPNGHIVFANAAARRILGWTFDAMRKASYANGQWGLLHLDGTPWLAEEQPASEALRTGRAVRDALMGFEREMGGRCWISVTATPIVRATGEPGGVVVTFDDVTEQREADLARLESEGRFRSAVDSMFDAFMIVRSVREDDRIVDFVFEFVNRAAEAHIGLRPDELIGQRMLEIAPNLGTRDAFGRCVHAVETGAPVVLDVPWFDGPRMHGAFEVRGVPVGDGLALTIRNVTQRRLAEASAAQAVRPGDEPADAPVAEAREDAPRLTARELEVLALLARGVSTRGISERLFISLNTARNHVQRTIAKLGAHSRLEAVAIARRYGLLVTD